LLREVRSFRSIALNSRGEKVVLLTLFLLLLLLCSCFKSAWRAHCAAHHTSLRNGVGSSSGSNGHGIGGKRNVSKSTFIEEDLETDPQVTWHRWHDVVSPTADGPHTREHTRVGPQAADAVAAAAAALVSEQEAENETWVECSSQKVRAWLLWMSNNTSIVA
jgi:hypothetical protein